MTRLSLLVLAGTALTTPALAQDRAPRSATYVQPYVELNQTVVSDLSNDDTTTYSTVSAGIDAGVQTARAEAQISYRYDRWIGWERGLGDQDIHTGLARGSYLIGNGLALEGGAMATRTRSDIRGDAPGILAGNTANTSQLYSLYAGPTLTTNAGPVAVNGLYRFGYTKVEVPNIPSDIPGRRLDYFDDSTNHVAMLSAGLAPNTVLPFGITLSGAYEREDAGQLDAQYEGWYGRGDVVLPVSRTFAVRGGVGYEKIEASQRDALVNAAGDPVLDGNGRFVTDPNSPQRIAYNTDGLIYDAGVIWRPNPRLELQANAGWRYGGEIYTGSLSYQLRKDVGLQVVVYDGIETFGRQLRDGLAEMPTSFVGGASPFGQQFNGCVFGSRPGVGGGGAGGCLNDVFQSVSTASYRARGVDGVLSVMRGRTTYGIGAGYANRRLFAPRATPGVTIYAVEDQSWYGQAFWQRSLDRTSSLDATVYANWYDSGFAGANTVFGAGAQTTYNKQFGRLGTLAALGVYTSDDGFDDYWVAQALLGARYTF